MPQPKPVKILRLHFGESDRYDGTPLQEAILAKCREMRIAGATVFRGLEGYGETAEIHRHRFLAHDQPLVVVIVDSAENIARLTPEVEAMMSTGRIAVSDAEAIRVEAVQGRET
jgi:PII-like signaling protein